MKKLYETILGQLEKISELKYIDFNTGQLEMLAENMRPSVLFPCALIEIDYPSCEDTGDKKQDVIAQITIKIAIATQNPTDSLVTNYRRDESLRSFELIDNIHNTLQGFSTNEFSNFSRKTLNTDRSFAGIRIINLVYETTFEE